MKATCQAGTVCWTAPDDVGEIKKNDTKCLTEEQRADLERSIAARKQEREETARRAQEQKLAQEKERQAAARKQADAQTRQKVSEQLLQSSEKQRQRLLQKAELGAQNSKAQAVSGASQMQQGCTALRQQYIAQGESLSQAPGHVVCGPYWGAQPTPTPPLQRGYAAQTANAPIASSPANAGPGPQYSSELAALANDPVLLQPEEQRQIPAISTNPVANSINESTPPKPANALKSETRSDVSALTVPNTLPESAAVQDPGTTSLANSGPTFAQPANQNSAPNSTRPSILVFAEKISDENLKMLNSPLGKIAVDAAAAAGGAKVPMAVGIVVSDAPSVIGAYQNGGGYAGASQFAGVVAVDAAGVAGGPLGAAGAQVAVDVGQTYIAPAAGDALFRLAPGFFTPSASAVVPSNSFHVGSAIGIRSATDIVTSNALSTPMR